MRCLSDQRYNFLKANHNYSDNEQVIKLLFIRSKIQFFESKSQLWCWTIQKIICCLSDQRYNFLKANHNSSRELYATCRLFIRSKIQFFESKSQPTSPIFTTTDSCLSDQRYNFLKANHNLFGTQTNFTPVVYQIKDTIFWKQITTLSNPL